MKGLVGMWELGWGGVGMDFNHSRLKAIYDSRGKRLFFVEANPCNENFFLMLIVEKRYTD